MFFNKTFWRKMFLQRKKNSTKKRKKEFYQIFVWVVIYKTTYELLKFIPLVVVLCRKTEQRVYF
jgi:hypothetical protein